MQRAWQGVFALADARCFAAAAAGGTLTCDGGRTLPSAALNDDFCDCADGSDEPRTSACAGAGAAAGSAPFRCGNAGSVATALPSGACGGGRESREAVSPPDARFAACAARVLGYPFCV